MTKRQVRFFSKDMGQVGWTRWFDISSDDELDALHAAIERLEIERVEVVEEMTRKEFETQFLVALSE